MTFEIRECRIDDAFDICEINRNDLGYSFSTNETVKNLSVILQKESDKVFVAIADGKVAGYVHANIYELIYSPKRVNIMGIAVSSGYRKQGIGKALISKVEAWAKENDAKGIRLVSGEHRKEAHCFYQGVGFIKSKTQFNFKKDI